MSARIVIAAVAVAVMISPSFAQGTPETSPAALAAPQAKSEHATPGTDSAKTAGTERKATAKRLAEDVGSGKTAAQPTAKK
jgi:hypothetical protein